MDFNLGKTIRSSHSLSFSTPNPDLSSPFHLYSATFVQWSIKLTPSTAVQLFPP